MIEKALNIRIESQAVFVQDVWGLERMKQAEAFKLGWDWVQQSLLYNIGWIQYHCNVLYLLEETEKLKTSLTF